MDSIANLLQTTRSQEPPQLLAIKEYVKIHHNIDVKTAVTSLGYTVTVPVATLATTLRMEIPKIEKECSLDKKLFIRIGHF
jgi:hypothetical protein